MFCKLSGLVTEADWQTGKSPTSSRTSRPLWSASARRACSAPIGPSVNWPGPIDRVHAALLEALGPLTETERDWIFGGTATQFYRLAP